MWAILSRNPAVGQLILRVGLGCFFIYAFGWKKLAGGIETWSSLGKAMSVVGIKFWPVFWGFLATMAETLCMALFVIGFAFRPACLVIAVTMTIAALSTYYKSGFQESTHAIGLAIVFFSMMFIGPGRYSVDKQ